MVPPRHVAFWSDFPLATRLLQMGRKLSQDQIKRQTGNETKRKPGITKESFLAGNSRVGENHPWMYKIHIKNILTVAAGLSWSGSHETNATALIAATNWVEWILEQPAWLFAIRGKMECLLGSLFTCAGDPFKLCAVEPGLAGGKAATASRKDFTRSLCFAAKRLKAFDFNKRESLHFLWDNRQERRTGHL